MRETEIIGYFKEYYCNNNFIGSVTLKENDHKGLGYDFRKFYKAEETIKIGKRKILKGQDYFTVVFPLCGKLKEQ